MRTIGLRAATEGWVSLPDGPNGPPVPVRVCSRHPRWEDRGEGHQRLRRRKVLKDFEALVWPCADERPLRPGAVAVNSGPEIGCRLAGIKPPMVEECVLEGIDHQAAEVQRRRIGVQDDR